MLTSEIKKLNDVILDLAKVFLINAQEFYPFGMVMYKDGTFAPLTMDPDDDHPSSIEVLNLLEDYISRNLSTSDFEVAAIGVDVFYSSESEALKKTAIQTRVMEKNGARHTLYTIYKITENDVELDDSFEGE